MPHQLRPRLAPPAAALLLAGVFLGGAEGLGPLLDGHPGLMTLSLDAWLVAALPLALAAVAGTCAVRLAAPRWAPAGRLLSFLGSPVPLERAWPAGVLLATGGVLVLGPLAGSFVRTGLERVTVEGLARLLSGLGTLLLLGLLALACFAAARLVLRTAGARWRAAVAPSHLAAWTLLTPVLGWSLALYRLHGEHLGAVVLPLGTGLLLLLGLLLWSPLSRLGDGLLRALVAVLVCGTLLVTAAAAARRPAEGEGPALASLPWTAAMTARLRSLTDLDGDAHSSVFGGGDCEPLDPEIHPGARDEPDNGVDENCDGEDAQEQEGLRLGDPTPRVLPGARRHNVVVVLMDALRGDRMHFLGYNRKTTPQLDRLAEEALVAERAYSQSSCSRKSIPSFLSGRYPQHMEWDRSQRYYGIEPGNVMLAELFREAGYQTAAVVNAWLKGRLQGFGQGFDSFVSVYTQKNWKDASNRSSPIAVVKAIEFLEHRDPDRPFLLFVYLEDAHHPYRNHPPPAATFGTSESDRYDGEISYADAWAGFLFEYLRQKGLWDDTILVVLSDHGEEFREHGMTQHCKQLFVESIRTVLLVRIPGVPAARIRQPVAPLDVLPTLLDATGIDTDRDRLQGQSLFATLEEDPEAPSTRPLFGYVRPGEGDEERSHYVLLDRWHYILDPSGGAEELFDLTRDPGEKTSLVRRNQRQVRIMRQLLDRFLQDANLP